MPTALTALTDDTALTVVMAVSAVLCQPLHPPILKGGVKAVQGLVNAIRRLIS
jgi:hypothetical protein